MSQLLLALGNRLRHSTTPSSPLADRTNCLNAQALSTYDAGKDLSRVHLWCTTLPSRETTDTEPEDDDEPAEPLEVNVDGYEASISESDNSDYYDADNESEASEDSDTETFETAFSDASTFLESTKFDPNLVEEFGLVVDQSDDQVASVTLEEEEEDTDAYDEDSLIKLYAPILPRNRLPPGLVSGARRALHDLYPEPLYPICGGSYGVVKYLTRGEKSAVAIAQVLKAQRGAPDMPRGQLVCVKTYCKGKDADPSDIENPELTTEIRAYKRISAAPRGRRDDKPGLQFLVEIDAFLSDMLRSYIIMPLMDHTLKHVIRDEPSALNRVAHTKRLLAQLVSGVAALHSIGIIHRDIKPDNILIDYCGNVRICDFNVSKIRECYKSCIPGELYAQAYVGTLPYMAPEVRLNQGHQKQLPYGLEVDYWAIGCIAFELESTYGDVLFKTTESFDNWCSANFARYDFLEVEGLGERARSLVTGLTHPEPRGRYGLRELLFHPYFVAGGVSEFQFLEDNAYRRIYEKPKIEVPPKYRAIYKPHRPSKLEGTWVNPFGSLFPEEESKE